MLFPSAVNALCTKLSNRLAGFITLFTMLCTLAGCVSGVRAPLPAPTVPVVTPPPIVEQVLESQTGLASYYHPSLDGEQTASGIIFDNTALMAAHGHYPFGTVVRITNLEKPGTTVEVRIVDRGPTQENGAEGVIIDVSGAAADRLGMIRDGRIEVKVEVLAWGEGESG